MSKTNVDNAFLAGLRAELRETITGGTEPNPVLQGNYVAIRFPEGFFKAKKTELYLSDSTIDSYRADYISKGDAFPVYAVGAACTFVKPGDIVSISGIGRPMQFDVFGEDKEPLFIIRETDITLKL